MSCFLSSVRDEISKTVFPAIEFPSYQATPNKYGEKVKDFRTKRDALPWLR